MKIFITGNLGFIGSELARCLATQSHTLIGYDKVPSSRNENYPCIKGNILDLERLTHSIPDDTELIIHLAAEHKDEGPSRKDYFMVNDIGTQNLLEIAAQKNINRFIFFSSVAVYGNQDGATEETSPAPINSYGESKLAAERGVEHWVSQKSTRWAIIVRPTVVYGPNNRANIYRLMKQVSNGRFLMVGNGENIKSVAFIKNVVASTIYLMNTFEEPLAVYNLVDQPQIPVKDFVFLIGKCSNKSVLPLKIPPKMAIMGAYFIQNFNRLLNRKTTITVNRLLKFTSMSYFEGTKLRNMGYKQPYSTENGVLETIKWNIHNGWKDAVDWGDNI